MSKSKDADDIDIDYLLETLSPEELEKLGEELIDPDVSQFSFHRCGGHCFMFDNLANMYR